MSQSIVFRMGALLLASFVMLNSVLADGGETNTRSLPGEIKLLVDGEQFDQAIVALNEFVSDESRNADAWNLLGYSQRKTGLLEESLVSYKKALKLDRKHLGAHEYIGELYLTMGDAKSANKHLAKLKKYCGDCHEYQDLAEAIANHSS